MFASETGLKDTFFWFLPYALAVCNAPLHLLTVYLTNVESAFFLGTVTYTLMPKFASASSASAFSQCVICPRAMCVFTTVCLELPVKGILPYPGMSKWSCHNGHVIFGDI